MRKTVVGITGAEGFIGSHLARYLISEGSFDVIPGARSLFGKKKELESFASRCRFLVHLAGMSRSEDGELLYRTNMKLVTQLSDAVCRAEDPPAVFFGSTTHTDKDSPYHASKRDGMALLRERVPDAVEIRMPNVFGPGSRPFFNSVVSTFCHLAAAGRAPEEIRAAELHLISVGTLVRHLAGILRAGGRSRVEVIPDEYVIPLPELWDKLVLWREYLNSGELPRLVTPLDADLWTTLRSYAPPVR